MNKIGIYYAYWTHDWDADFELLVRKVSKLGFDVLEVNAGKVINTTSDERKRLRDVAVEEDIDLSYCIGLTKEYDVASENESVRRNGIRFLKDMTATIQDIGGNRLSGIIYGSWPATLPEGVTDKSPYLERSVASMKETAKTAEECGVLLNVEVVNRFEQFLLNTCDEALDYVEKVGSPNVKILLDTFHMNIEEDTIYGAIRRAGDKLGHLHIGENNRNLPGCGHIPWEEIVEALKNIGYSGYIVMEPFLMPGGEVGRDIKVFRDMSIGLDLDLEAKKALEFVRAKLSAD